MESYRGAFGEILDSVHRFEFSNRKTIDALKEDGKID